MIKQNNLFSFKLKAHFWLPLSLSLTPCKQQKHSWLCIVSFGEMFQFFLFRVQLQQFEPKTYFMFDKDFIYI